MKRCYAILTIMLLPFLLPTDIAAQGRNDKLHFNVGVKVGFQAVTYNDPDFEIKGYIFDHDNIQSNKIGYALAPFLRLTKGRYYIQTETTLGITNHNFNFKDKEEPITEGTQQGNIVYDLKTYCLQVPILFGYSFVNEGKFGMSIFTGPRTKFTFTTYSQQDFRNFKQEGLNEVLSKQIYYWEIGLGVNIDRVFFDFVYDIGISDVSKYILDKSGERHKSTRRDNILSFSVGLMF